MGQSQSLEPFTILFGMHYAFDEQTDHWPNQDIEGTRPCVRHRLIVGFREQGLSSRH